MEVEEGSDQLTHLLSCQPIRTLASCFVYKVIRDLESINHLCINDSITCVLILIAGRDKYMYTCDLSIRFSSGGVYKLMSS